MAALDDAPLTLSDRVVPPVNSATAANETEQPFPQAYASEPRLRAATHFALAISANNAGIYGLLEHELRTAIELDGNETLYRRLWIDCRLAAGDIVDAVAELSNITGGHDAYMQEFTRAQVAMLQGCCATLVDSRWPTAASTFD
jgi:hypothetical protein